MFFFRVDVGCILFMLGILNVCVCVGVCACFVGAGGYKSCFFQCERDHIPSMQKSIFIVQVLVFHSCVGGGGGGDGG